MLIAELTNLAGLPAHPLIVHLPVVFVPLAFLGSVLALAVKRWRGWLLPLTAVFAGVSLIGVQLAVMSGEGLEELLDEESAAIERHAELGEQARPFVFAFLVFAVLAAVAWYLIGKAGDTPEAQARVATWRKLAIPFMALSILTGALSTIWVFRTGHTGAESVWEEDEGGETGGDRDADHSGYEEREDDDD